VKFNYIARFLLISGLRDVFFQVKRENRHQKRKLTSLRLGKFSTNVQAVNSSAAMQSEGVI
jgi:hypothetical protein